MAVRILIDSASDIDSVEAETLGVTLLPMEVRIGSVDYLDGVNLSHREFFEKLVENTELPKTSQINEYRFDESFNELTKNGDEVVAIVMSSKLSGTFNNAKRAAKKYGEKVYVVDSLNVCIGERILCNLALRLKNEGKSAREIAAELDEKKKRIKLIALLDTLEYLKKGGRISAVTAIVGSVFSIKPVIAIVNGEVKAIGKAMGSKQGNNLLRRMIAKGNGVDFSLPFAGAYSGLSDALLKKYLEDSAELCSGAEGEMYTAATEKLPRYMIGSTIGVHIGPGAIGVAFFEK